MATTLANPTAGSLPFPKHHDHTITLEEAAKLTRLQRNELDPTKRGMDKPYAFRREALDAILAQSGCEGVRFYPCLHESGSASVVAIGVDGSGKDMIHGALMQETIGCPPYCWPPDINLLNSDI